MSDFVSLHTHTTYSLMDSLIKPSELFKKVKELGQSAVGVTEHASLASAWDCLKYSKEAGVKLIMGCEFNFVDDLTDENGRVRHVILLAKNHEGYKNLLLANKLANDHGIVRFKKVMPRIDWKILEQVQKGLICTTACGGGILGHLINTRRPDEAKKQAQRLKDIFGDSLALEIQPHFLRRLSTAYNDYEDQRLVNNTLIKFGRELDIKVIAACDAHYLTKDQAEAHDVLLAIGSGQPVKSGSRLKYDPEHPEFYVKSREEVINFFSRLYPKQAEEFCDNTLYFSDMCEMPEWIDPKYSNPSGKELPTFPVKDQSDYQEFREWIGKQSGSWTSSEDSAYLRFICDKAFNNKVPSGYEQEYHNRLKEEFEVLEFHGFSSYMLIVADYVEWAKKNGISVGPGRGSVGGSLVGYLAGIHLADPIKYNLIFARFHNKEKTSFPDIDLDFAPSGRDIVHSYIRQKYGADKIAHVSNINTITPKVFARDIARAFEFGGDRKAAVAIGTAIADSIPKEIRSVEEALEKAPLFSEYANSNKYQPLKKFASYLEGKAKAYSTHAGGIVIGSRSLSEIVPVRKDKDGSVAIEYDKERAESNGLVKMDTLGLETLDIIQNTYNLIKFSGKTVPPMILNYDEYDQPTYDLISRGDTLCVFQLGGSAGTSDLCRKVRPKNIEDISIINSLARPSAKDIRVPFIETKEGKRPFQLLHPNLKRAFGGTLGFGLYEECLMFLAQDVAGWDLHEADRLRKLTKEKGKNPKKAAQWRQEFIDGATKNNIDEKTSIKIWDEVVEKFQGYGFNACLTGDTVVYRSGANQYQDKAQITIKELFVAQSSKTPWGQKIRAGKLQLLQMDSDGVIRPGLMKKIYNNGIRQVVKITTSKGRCIIATNNHKLLTDNGYEIVENLRVGQNLICLGENIKQKIGPVIRGVGKTYEGRGVPYGEENPSWIDGRQVYFNQASEQVLKRANGHCEFCGDIYSARHELAHMESLEYHNGDYSKYHSEFNIKYLCNSCHKKLDYQKGERKKRWTKGQPTECDFITSIECAGEQEVFDIEMNTSEHNFLANEIISHNSHSILYSFISYHTAYLKAHFPLEFLTANLMSEVNSNAKVADVNIAMIKEEIRKYNVNINPPDINKSEMVYKIIDDKTLLTGLDSLKFIGKDAIPEILAKRPFSSFEDFLSKVDGKKVKAPAVQALAASGCLDSFGMPRRIMYLYASDFKKKLQVYLKKNKKSGGFNYPWPNDIEDWTVAEKYAMEIYYLGEGLSGSMREAYPGFFDKKVLDFSTLLKIEPQENRTELPLEQHVFGAIQGVIKDLFEFKVKKEGSKIFGETMAKISLLDPFGNTVGITVFPKKLRELNSRLREMSGGKAKLEAGTAIHIAASLNWYEGDISLLFNDLKKCSPPPPLPSDLEAKKVSMRISGPSKKKSKDIDPEEFLDEVEDELIEEGLDDSEDNIDDPEMDAFN